MFIWFLLAAMVFLIPGAAAATIETGSRAVTLSGPTGILVPIGFENFMPLAQARFWYNWICVIIIMPIGAYASGRNKEQFAILIPIIAAILVGFGWLQTGNMVQTVGAIVAYGLLGGALYMKDRLRQTWGMGGPGSTIMNIAVFMILLSAVFGLVNSSGIWQENTGASPNQFLNVDLENEVTSITNAGGIFDDVTNAGMALLQAGLASLKVILAIIASIAVFSGALLLMYPWLAQSAFALGILAIFQTAIWILYAKLINDVFYAKSIYATEF